MRGNLFNDYLGGGYHARPVLAEHNFIMLMNSCRFLVVQEGEASMGGG
ncbi:hypothetical protein MPQ_1895 [Methylovorus sp. MP688]|nr:hypothetical protein MPQ_1895 [Methylovorus sp. MP688]